MTIEWAGDAPRHARHGQGGTAQDLIHRLRRMGLDVPDGTTLARTYASGATTAAGAWSWFALGPEGAELNIGSSLNMRTLARARRLTASRAGEGKDIEIDTTDDLDVLGGHWTRDPATSTETLYEPKRGRATPHDRSTMPRSRHVWRAMADRLAARMYHHANCPSHPIGQADPDNCPFCDDRDAYLAYEAAAFEPRPTDWLVLDMDDGVLRRERTLGDAVEWLMDHMDAPRVLERIKYGAGAYEYKIGTDAEDCDAAFIERADVAAQSGGWHVDQEPLFPYRSLPHEGVNRPGDREPEPGTFRERLDRAVEEER